MIPLGIMSFVEGLLGPKFGKFAKPLIYGVIGLLALLAVFAVVKIHDHRVVAAHEAKQDAANAKADRKADTTAAEQRRADDSRSTLESTQIKEAVNEAGNDPAARRAAYYKCVSAQQSARRAGKPSAVC